MRSSTGLHLYGVDTKFTQIFTLVHELAHIWLGETALDDADLTSTPTLEAERWCNQVAAEILVPFADIAEELRNSQLLTDQLERLARKFKVSTLVVLRRVYDVGQLSWQEYRVAYETELERSWRFSMSAHQAETSSIHNRLG